MTKDMHRMATRDKNKSVQINDVYKPVGFRDTFRSAKVYADLISL